MIVRRSGGGYVADREWLTAFYGLSAETIRKRWEPVAYDPSTRAALYELDEEAIAEMKRRAKT